MTGAKQGGEKAAGPGGSIHVGHGQQAMTGLVWCGGAGLTLFFNL